MGTMAERVSALVLSDGRSPPSIARSAGLTKQGLYNIMYGTTKPETIRARNVLSLARTLGTTVEYIMEGERSDPRAFQDLAAGMVAMCEMLSGSIPGAAAELADKIAAAAGPDLADDRLAKRMVDILRRSAAPTRALPTAESTPHVPASARRSDPP